MLPFIRRQHQRRYAVHNNLHGIDRIFVPYSYPTLYPQGHYLPLMVVGEFPNVDDCATQTFLEPSGPEGHMFNTWLKKAQLLRGTFPLLSVFRYRPVRNDPLRFFTTVKSGKPCCLDIAPFEKGHLIEHFRSERDALRDAILEFRPEVVITLGPLALWAVIDNNRPVHHFTEQPQGYTCTLEHRKKKQSFILIPAYRPSTSLITKDSQFEDISVRAFKVAAKILRPAS